MNTDQPPVTAITDRDRHRACRLAHAFGVSASAALALLLGSMALFRVHPLSDPELLWAGSFLVLLAGLLADLAVRPPQVVIREGWLAVSRLGRRRSVRTDRLVRLSANPRAAGSLILADEAGNWAEIDVRCLVRNPLIWQRIQRGVSCSCRRRSLELAEPDSRFWESVAREVERAQRRALAALDFQPSG
jgi:hypothetical protein